MKKTPIQHPMNPTNEAIKETINNKSIIKGCFMTMMKLDLMASTALLFPKIIRGTVNIVKNVMVNDINNPIVSIPTCLRIVEMLALISVIIAVAVKISLKKGDL